MTVTLNSSQVQQNFGDVLDQALRGEDVIVTRYGAPRAALIGYEQYRTLVSAQQTLKAAAETATPGQIKESTVAYQIAGDHRLPGQRRTHAGVEAPYVTVTPGVCGGRPAIRGTRIPVKAIVGYHKLGLRVDEILEGLPSLTSAQVYAALSYYYDHQDEIEREIQEDQQENLTARYGLQVAADGRIMVAG